MLDQSVVDSYDALEDETTMDIRVDAKVHCADGAFGRTTHIIIDPASQQVAHLVVKVRRPPRTERLVPIQWVTETTHDLVRLRCTNDELIKM